MLIYDVWSPNCGSSLAKLMPQFLSRISSCQHIAELKEKLDINSIDQKLSKNVQNQHPKIPKKLINWPKMSGYGASRASELLQVWHTAPGGSPPHMSPSASLPWPRVARSRPGSVAFLEELSAALLGIFRRQRILSVQCCTARRGNVALHTTHAFQWLHWTTKKS